MGANGSTGPEAVAYAEKNAALLTARAGARDPSAIPSICRISAALQYPAGKIFFFVFFSKIQGRIVHLSGQKLFALTRSFLMKLLLTAS
jgi:hypothetical protein